jgi:hypothetical protein
MFSGIERRFAMLCSFVQLTPNPSSTGQTQQLHKSTVTPIAPALYSYQCPAELSSRSSKQCVVKCVGTSQCILAAHNDKGRRHNGRTLNAHRHG